MHGMLSAVTLLTETPLTIEQRDLAGIIEESGSVLLQVINDILDYSKLSSGVFQLSTTDFSFKDTINAVVRSTVIGLKTGLQVRNTIDERVPDVVKGDALRLRQVLQNILGNAVKFTEFGTVDVNVSLINRKETSVEILTEVSDTGVGMVPLSLWCSWGRY
jgi:osomolarity two-component system, sensor histidine kinase TcsA